MKKVITLSEFRNQSPYKYGKLITALNRNRVDTSNKKKRNFNAEFGKNDIIKYISNRILNN
jgi:hypothetical protein